MTWLSIADDGTMQWPFNNPVGEGAQIIGPGRQAIAVSPDGKNAYRW